LSAPGLSSPRLAERWHAGAGAAGLICVAFLLLDLTDASEPEALVVGGMATVAAFGIYLSQSVDPEDWIEALLGVMAGMYLRLEAPGPFRTIAGTGGMLVGAVLGGSFVASFSDLDALGWVAGVGIAVAVFISAFTASVAPDPGRGDPEPYVVYLDPERHPDLVPPVEQNPKPAAGPSSSNGQQLLDPPEAPAAEAPAPDRAEEAEVSPEPERLEDLMAELNRHVGLEPVKQQVRDVVALLEIDQKRAEVGYSVERVSPPHLIFLGPPGTGKTTVARLIGRIYRALGVLSTGHVIEATRGDLVGQHLGSTALKTNAVIDRAMGGVLLLDEAYTLAQQGLHGGDAYGGEAIATLLKRMEDDRLDLTVIVAGYPREMEHFLASNSGLQSRFPQTLRFPPYNPDELVLIAERMIEDRQYALTPEGAKALPKALNGLVQSFGGEPSWGNAREVRDFVELLRVAHAVRLKGRPTESRSELALLTPGDVEVAVRRFSAGREGEWA
jgi:hypothetical protein